jgi:hypothetical protein
MSIASDVRSYADAALEQGRQVVDQAQARFTGVRGDATDLANKVTGTAGDVVENGAQSFADRASETCADLRVRSEALYGRVSSLPAVESVTSTVEPYVAQLNAYRIAATDKAEELYAELKKNEQVAKALNVAEAAAGVVVETVNERVVNPVKSMLEREPVTRTTPAAEAKPAKPAAATKATGSKTSATATKSAATKSAATKPAASAAKAPAKRTTTRRTTKA